MKKNHFIVVAMCFFTLSANAQFKVDSIGSVCIGVQHSQPNAILSVGTLTTNSVVGKVSVYSRLSPGVSASTENVIGIYSNVWGNTSDTKKDIGAIGHVGNGNSGKSYGVIGSIGSLLNGAGIYATAGGYGNTLGETLTGKYAGYFAGPTCVSGTLTATEVVTPSDITLKENITSITDEEETAGSTLENLMGVNVIKYNYKAKEYKKDPDEEALYEDEASEAEAEKIARQRISEMAEQRHYGVSAQEVQEVFPDLVRTNQDGTLSVNYVELVPILIRSIQELKAELDELKGSDARPAQGKHADSSSQTEWNAGLRQGTDRYPIIVDGKTIGKKHTKLSK